ncbi:hypothetical protein CCACVL1_03341, partial [Corchorus capsularis]
AINKGKISFVVCQIEDDSKQH